MLTFESLVNSRLDVMALPMTFATFENVFYSQAYTSYDGFKLSRALGIHIQGNLLGRVESGIWPKFKFFEAYEPQVWLFLLVAFVVMSLLLVNHTGSVKTAVWMNTILLFGQSTFITRVDRKLFILFFFWMTSTLILSSGLRGLILNFFLQPMPKVVIDSWTDLFHRKEVSIIGLPLSHMTHFIDAHFDSEEMARDFADRYFIKYPESVNRESSPMSHPTDSQPLHS